MRESLFILVTAVGWFGWLAFGLVLGYLIFRPKPQEVIKTVTGGFKKSPPIKEKDDSVIYLSQDHEEKVLDDMNY